MRLIIATAFLFVYSQWFYAQQPPTPGYEMAATVINAAQGVVQARIQARNTQRDGNVFSCGLDVPNVILGGCGIPLAPLRLPLSRGLAGPQSSLDIPGRLGLPPLQRRRPITHLPTDPNCIRCIRIGYQVTNGELSEDIRHIVWPMYPGIQATGKVEALIAVRHGKSSVRITHKSKSQDLDSATLTGLSQWIFWSDTDVDLLVEVIFSIEN